MSHQPICFKDGLDPVLLFTFTAEGINGKGLLTLKKSDLKDIGISTLGRRLEVYEEIKKLTSKQEEEGSTKSEGHHEIIICACIDDTRK